MTTSSGRIQTSYFLLFPEVSGNPDAANLARAARYTQGVIWNQTEVLVTPGPPYEPPQTWTPITDISDAIKALNPSTRIGLYCGSGMFSRPYEPGYTFIDDADLFHKPDGTGLIYTVNDVNHRFPNIKRGEIRDRLASDYAAFAAEHDFDLLVWDSWSPPAMANWISLPEPSGFFDLPGGILEGAAHTEAFWEDVFTPYTLGVKEALEADGRKLYLNGLGFDPSPPASTYLGVHTTNVVDYATGALNEVAYRCYGNATLFEQTVEMMRLATAGSRGEVYFLAQPALLSLTDPGVSYTVGTELMWFYLATYLLIDCEDLTYFGYWPNTAYVGLQAGSPYVNYEDAWDLIYGKPTGHRVDGGTTRLYWRRFTHGVAVVNPTANELTFREPGAYRVRHPTSGLVVNVGPEATTWYAMPPYSGAFLFFRRDA